MPREKIHSGACELPGADADFQWAAMLDGGFQGLTLAVHHFEVVRIVAARKRIVSFMLNPQ
ncbi:TPA: hypothetical protein SLU74_004856 [Pseudomonas aeruginosa]|nr:hypothetical protein [Pseudomonas aeruginosa]EKW7235546.1 hypothetical protein [Pseudomonas aeruginosa]MBI8707160.1 hypothetical protein [Pseudomonas aeruginosa]MBI8829063.1 hypothetical protein [Pseudomonas aeruginosa]MDI4098780.1 hypothetical protein [Pseudomonas aeruginosa]QKR10872.1 hypothetical protein HB744_20505 [Pseudomonas aeruginosa]